MKNIPIICGIEIATDAEGRFNLNALHKASGEGKHKSPNQWFRTKQTQELIAELDANLLKNIQTQNMQLAQKSINVVHGGSNPGTFAHELLAIEYAGWISPAFRLQVNQAFIDLKTGQLQRQQRYNNQGWEQSSTGLLEYRRAKATAIAVDTATKACDLLPHLSSEAKQCLAAVLVNPIAGREIIPLPQLEEHYFSAKEIGEYLGVSANKIGRIANANNLKTEQYGKFFLDKSAHSNKQVEAFRYNELGVQKISEILYAEQEAKLLIKQ